MEHLQWLLSRMVKKFLKLPNLTFERFVWKCLLEIDLYRQKYFRQKDLFRLSVTEDMK